ncbi:hypothetical protein HID58_050903 [Brassica napus]|uniref:Uncharacterized protein n=1 Tax=Brassica napus TaxID=3708 RepID=A0ABQ8A7P9_BRANA|nr:hypothetical protein HID58_050903 [Brassica napus]
MGVLRRNSLRIITLEQKYSLTRQREEEKLTDISTAQRALFKLILKAWSQLSDQEGKHKNSGIQKSQKPHEPASSNKPRPKPKPEYEPPPKFEPTFWKGCNRCKTYCEFMRADYLNKSS